MNDSVKNGATAKADSQLPNTPVATSGHVSADLDAEIENLQKMLRAKRAQRDAEAIANRAAKARKAAQAVETEQEALRCRVYKANWAVFARDKNMQVAKDILAEFTTNSINQRYTLEAMKARSDAATIAKAQELAQK
ncbi:MAG: hypothetical protein WAK55_17435 [Xanthobacteraceae bacterium]